MKIDKNNNNKIIFIVVCILFVGGYWAFQGLEKIKGPKDNYLRNEEGLIIDDPELDAKLEEERIRRDKLKKPVKKYVITDTSNREPERLTVTSSMRYKFPTKKTKEPPKTLSGRIAAGLYKGPLYAIIEIRDFSPITVKLFPELVPITVAHFTGLANAETPSYIHKKDVIEPHHFYDGLLIHRIMTNRLIQMGAAYVVDDPGSKVVIKEDYSEELKHDRPGVLAMANSGKGYTGAQFYITTKEDPELDGRFSIIGHVIQGQETVNKIAATQTNQLDIPLHLLVIDKIRIYDNLEAAKKSIK